ncbi:MAG TPA: HAMP domain-containing sensor histidine kinase [Vicinamibacterales bacterium]|nr:HAMP domain-containing sensor histidine kinase [Vicinamibacterales bacterium]
MVYIVAALLSAASLVVYFQHRNVTSSTRQRELTVRAFAQQSATLLAGDVHRVLDGPTFDTLTAVNHPLLRENRLDLVAGHYDRGLKTYPHVERFFVWTHETGTEHGKQVIFRDRPSEKGPLIGVRLTGDSRSGLSSEGWSYDPALGTEIYALAVRHAPAQQIYLAAERVVDGTTYQIFVRTFWTDARRERFFALLGFVVNVGAVHRTLFPMLFEGPQSALRVSGVVPLDIRIADERGATLFATTAEPLALSTRLPFAVRFYPADEIASRLAAGVPQRTWVMEIGPSQTTYATQVNAGGAEGYWLSAAAVALMLIGLGIAVQAQRRARHLSRMQSEFVTHVSHQLKTPVSLLTGMLETLALDRVRTPEQRGEYLDGIRSEAARLTSLVEQILQMSRAEQSRGRLELEVVDLAALVQDVAAEFRNGHRRRLQLTVEAPSPGPRVVADPAALEQMIFNLLDNALKYSPRPARVELRVSHAAADAAIEVEDHGPGIPADEQKRVFDPFFRGRGAAVAPGFGLGLAIVRDLASAQRGTVQVDSIPGRGTTFRIRIPLLQSAKRRSPGLRALFTRS